MSGYPASYATMLVLRVGNGSRQISEERFCDIEEYLRNSEQRLTGLEENSGFGMSMVYLLIRQMSGKLMLEKADNGGVVFTVNVPQLEVGEE